MKNINHLSDRNAETDDIEVINKTYPGKTDKLSTSVQKSVKNILNPQEIHDLYHHVNNLRSTLQSAINIETKNSWDRALKVGFRKYSSEHIAEIELILENFMKKNPNVALRIKPFLDSAKTSYQGITPLDLENHFLKEASFQKVALNHLDQLEKLFLN